MSEKDRIWLEFSRYHVTEELIGSGSEAPLPSTCDNLAEASERNTMKSDFSCTACSFLLADRKPSSFSPIG